jgi:hypothetical protein
MTLDSIESGAWSAYEQAVSQDLPVLVRPSMPIAWFGDLEAYLAPLLPSGPADAGSSSGDGGCEGYVRELFAGVAHAVEEHMEGMWEREERREADRRLFRLLVKNDIAHALDLGELEHAERLRVILQAIEKDNPLWPMWFRRGRGEEMR